MNLSPDALKRWPVVGGVLTLILLTALSLAYWDNYQDQQRYLQSRNFRLIAVLAGADRDLIDNRVRMVREKMGDAKGNGNLDAATWVAATVKDPKIQRPEGRRADRSHGGRFSPPRRRGGGHDALSSERRGGGRRAQNQADPSRPEDTADRDREYAGPRGAEGNFVSKVNQGVSTPLS